MTIWNLMNIGRHALGAYRGSMEVSSQNAANAGVEGYSRRRAELTSLGLGRDRRVASGVLMNAPERVVDQFSTNAAWKSRATAAYHGGREMALEQIESIVAPQDGGLGPRIDELLDAFARLSSSPGSNAEREAVLYAAEALGEDFATTRGHLGRLQAPLSGLAEAQVDEINALSEEIATLNTQLQSAEAAQPEASELRDQRDRLLDQLTELSGANVIAQDDSTVTVSLPGGAVLVSKGQASQISTREAGGQLQLTLTSAEGAVRQLRPGSAGGELAGVLDARNEDVGGAITALDDLAFGLVEAINALHEQGFGTDGVSGRPLFENLASADGAAGLIVVDAAVEDNPAAIAATRFVDRVPGGSDLAIEISELRDASIAGLSGLTPAEAMARLQTDVGRQLNRAQAEVRGAEAQAETFSNIRESIRGVSLDEELSDLLRHQRGFEAASRIVQSADEMMQTVLGLVR